jgi:hypothetical protein
VFIAYYGTLVTAVHIKYSKTVLQCTINWGTEKIGQCSFYEKFLPYTILHFIVMAFTIDLLVEF